MYNEEKLSEVIHLQWNAASQAEWEQMSPQEKKLELFFKQKRTLDLFVERHAISQEQYNKSLSDLIEKMGIPSELLTKSSD